jgi:hypothetical protein
LKETVTDFDFRYTLAPAYGGKSIRQRWSQACAGAESKKAEVKGTVPILLLKLVLAL